MLQVVLRNHATVHGGIQIQDLRRYLTGPKFRSKAASANERAVWLTALHMMVDYVRAQGMRYTSEQCS